MAELTEEPREINALVLAGEPPDEVAFVRSDDSDPGDPHRWYALVGEEADPVTWAEVCRGEPAVPESPTSGRTRPVERLYRQADVDELVAKAGLRVIGDHIVAGDYCISCTSHHSTTELARLEDRLAEEDSRGD